MLTHLRALIPCERSSKLLRERGHDPSNGVTYRFGTVTSERRAMLLSRLDTVTGLRRQLQQQRESSFALDQGPDR